VSTLSPAKPARETAESSRPPDDFATTRWSVVLLAGRNDTERARTALAKLCQTYWYPLYAFVRRRGYSPPDAQDLTQGFFEQLLERQALAKADPARGRFRAFILTAMKNFIAHERERAQALKRGGGQEILSLDLAAAERRFSAEPVDAASPDKIFDRQWTLALLGEVLRKLEVEHQNQGKHEIFALLKETLAGARSELPYVELASRLDWSEGAVKVAVHRLRKRYRDLLKAEIAQTVAGPAEAEQEMRHLFASLAGE
jgi:RNA polymerase sigma factor (sigma-70 family)